MSDKLMIIELEWKKKRFPVFSEFMEVKMKVNDLQSHILFVIFEDDYNYRQHAKVYPSISIIRSKRSLYKIWCHIV